MYLISDYKFDAIYHFPSFAVSNVPCGSNGVVCAKSVTIEIYNMTIRLVRGMETLVGSTAIDTSQLQYHSKGLIIEHVGHFIVIIAVELGLTIKYDQGNYHHRLRKSFNQHNYH